MASRLQIRINSVQQRECDGMLFIMAQLCSSLDEEQVINIKIGGQKERPNSSGDQERLGANTFMDLKTYKSTIHTDDPNKRS